jgi:nitrogen regulatory protein PII
MLKMVILVTTHVEQTLEVAERWQDAGAPGVTIINTHGVRSLQREKPKPELSLAFSMASILSQIREANVMIFSIVPEDLVDSLLEIATSVVGTLERPETGIAFVIDVERVVGIRKSDGTY